MRLIPAHAGKTRPTRTPRPPTQAHPRSRGENGPGFRAVSPVRGSSPLTRGKLIYYTDYFPLLGLIPAHAGKTAPFLGPLRGPQAHPRSRGENASRSSKPMLIDGSSPLTRGKQPMQSRACTTPGLIPAHAGKTRPTKTPPAPTPAHPRSRGENSRIGMRPAFHRGSSPLTRGKPARRGWCLQPRGLIPAHAGKTRRRTRTLARCGAHPRSRGENMACTSRRMTR